MPTRRYSILPWRKASTPRPVSIAHSSITPERRRLTTVAGCARVASRCRSRLPSIRFHISSGRPEFGSPGVLQQPIFHALCPHLKVHNDLSSLPCALVRSCCLFLPVPADLRRRRTHCRPSEPRCKDSSRSLAHLAPCSRQIPYSGRSRGVVRTLRDTCRSRPQRGRDVSCCVRTCSLYSLRPYLAQCAEPAGRDQDPPSRRAR